MKAVPRSRLEGSSLTVAEHLLGALLICGAGEQQVTVRVVEVEAYAGAADPASHAYRGQTPRNAVMFGPAGHAYVYFTYGMHFCVNVSCGPVGTPEAVLLRAGAVVGGLPVAQSRRPGVSDRDLARGPARLCRTLGIDRSFDGADLCDARGPLWLAAGWRPASDSVRRGPRVGISQATGRPWRFWIDGEPAVSAYRAGRGADGGRQVSRSEVPPSA